MEILIAMALMTLVLGAVLFASSGTQQFLIGAGTNREAQTLAQQLVTTERSLANEDFNLVNPISTTTSGIYKEWVAVASSENFGKTITAYVSWDSGAHQVSLSTRVTDYTDAIGGDTCSSVLSGNWQRPATANFSFNALIGDTSTTTYPITDLDAYNGRLYATVSNTSENTKTFFIFDISSPLHPIFLGALDNDPADKTGLMAVAVATSSTSNYAYVASASSFSKGQLQIIDISNPSSPQLIKTFKIATSTVPAAGLGDSIFYKDGYVYVGLAAAAGGTEFNIIDVHNPLSPLRVGGYSFNSHAVNGMLIKNNYAYVLHPTDTTGKQQLTVLNISNPGNPALVGGFYTGDTNAHGKTAFEVGTTLYLGMTVSSTTPEFYLLDGSNPQTLSQKSPLAQVEVGSSVAGLLVRDSLAFLLTTKQPTGPGVLQILGATSTLPLAQVALPGPGASGVALDCEGNYLYAASNDSVSNGYLTVITGS